MRLKSFATEEIIQNGNTFNKLDSLLDNNKNNQEKLKLQENLKWEAGLTREKSDILKEDLSTPATTPTREQDSETSSDSEEDQSQLNSVTEEEEDSDLTHRPRSFANPNYPGFSHLAHELSVATASELDDDDTARLDSNNNHNNNNNNNSGDNNHSSNDNFESNRINELEEIDWVNRLEGCQVKEIYRRPKLDLTEPKESNKEMSGGGLRSTQPPAPPSGKREKTEINNCLKRSKAKDSGDFDVYNIETAMPKIDLEAIESHLRAAREEERRRRNDREEIRRRLACGDSDDHYPGETRPGKKPSLQARLQGGMNLQICFMNETSSDTESPSSEGTPTPPPTASGTTLHCEPGVLTNQSTGSVRHPPPTSLALPPASACRSKNINSSSESGDKDGGVESWGDKSDFFSRAARLQTEARLGLAQAKDRARLQMELDRRAVATSPITCMLRETLRKVGVKFQEDRRRLSRQMLTDMNVAQLQVIVNDLHTQIEILNESLVKYLMERDELHMSQDSMLVDIEDITRYLGAKQSSLKDDIAKNNNNNSQPSQQQQPATAPRRQQPATLPVQPPSRQPPVISRLVSLGKK